MTSPMSVRVGKSLLTRYSKALDEVFATNSKLEFGEANMRLLEEASAALNASIKLVSDKLQQFTETLDNLKEPLNPDQEAKYQEYLEEIQVKLERAQRLVVRIEAKKAGLRTPSIGESAQESADHPRAELPAIPIPQFSGALGEFDNFWALFEANVDSQKLTKLQKFNYLLKALKGEARQTVRKYAISEENYPLVIDLLKTKYGDKSKLIRHLQSRLEAAAARGNNMRDQRQLLDYITSLTTQLQHLGVNLKGSFITQKILAKFQVEFQRKILKRLCAKNASDDEWNVQEVVDELDKIVAAEERVLEMLPKKEPPSKQPSIERQHSQQQFIERQLHQPRAHELNAQLRKCLYCERMDHNALRCPSVTSLSDRSEFLRRNKLCMNCAKQNHSTRECLRKGCTRCDDRKHHFSICPKLFEKINTRGKSAKENAHNHVPTKDDEDRTTKFFKRANTQNVECVLSTKETEVTQCDEALSTEIQNVTEGDTQERSEVYLLTGTAHIQHPTTDRLEEVQILLDTGADKSFIQDEFAEKLQLPILRTIDLAMYTFGEREPKQKQYDITKARIWDSENQPIELTLYKTGVISASAKKIKLSSADKEYLAKEQIYLSNKQGSVIRPKILLGCDQLWNLIKFPCKEYTLPSGLRIIPSRLGYLLTGQRDSEDKQDANGTCNLVESDCDLLFQSQNEPQIEDREYWDSDLRATEEYLGPTKVERAREAKKVHEFFENTIEKRKDGYYVRLPFKDYHTPLPDNYKLAQRRLIGVMTKLREHPDLLEQYNAVFTEQLQMGIIETVPKGNPSTGMVHYLPHQAVVTPQKTTTKLRIVFDAASHYKGCPSLNEVLHQGPTLLPDLYGMLLRFRLKPYVSISDVEKAFLQVRLHETDRDATRFLWVQDIKLPPEGDNLICMRFTRVPFGLNASPFLLAGTVRFHLRNAVKDEALAQEIKDNLYVDNLVLGGDTPQELAFKSRAACNIFDEMGMNLREFLSNTNYIETVIPSAKCAKTAAQKVLGISWCAQEDSLHIHCKFPLTTTITKRTVTQQIASVYDPLGWLVPSMILPKQFQQTLWKHNYSWDEQLSWQHQEQWEKILQNASDFSKKCSRYIITSTTNNLVLFSDASEIAMATCAYLVSEGTPSLLMAKSRLSPLKVQTTMPKLEMSALAMASRLALSVLNALPKQGCTIEEVIFFSDSQIALSWIKKNPYQSNLGRFVNNRIKEISEMDRAIKEMGIKVRYGYIPSDSNPADAGTRGLSKHEMIDHYWWSGPELLRKPISTWYHSLFTIDSVEATQEAEVFATSTQSESDSFPWNRHSSFLKAQRTMAWVLRFLSNLLKRQCTPSRKRIGASLSMLKSDVQEGTALTGAEIDLAKTTLIKLHQNTFSEEYIKSMDNTLKLIKDSKGLLRARGRLGLSTLDEPAKFPILIAPKSEIANLIIHQAHGRYHSGVAHTMATVRTEYWIPQLRQKVRKLVQGCVRCRRFNASPYSYPPMPDLPEQRVQQSRPFEHIGLDFFDLPKVKEGTIITKVYGTIFTCAVTRLIHLEVVRDMGTEAFINALRRFFSRRGVPRTITCDNAPTFILSAEILKNTIENAKSLPIIANNQIEWKHITPYAPWQGGFYERLIQSIKHALYKALGRAIINMDSLTTIITEIEANLNSRPLTYQEVELEHLTPLRPIDFIQKDMVIIYPLETAAEFTEDPEYLPSSLRGALETRKQAEKALQSSYAITQKAWQIWHNEYLLSLREHHRKWLSGRQNNPIQPQVGAVVLLVDHILTRNEWRLARIVEIQPGNDGAIREAKLITATGRIISRPVNLIVPLELDQNRDASQERDQPQKQLSDESQLNSNSNLRDTAQYNLRQRGQVRYEE